MDKFGIFNLLSSLSKFYQENKTETEEKTAENNSANIGEAQSKTEQAGKEKMASIFGVGETKTERTEKKSDVETMNAPPSVQISKKMLETIASHDEFIRRVQEKNAKKPKR